MIHVSREEFENLTQEVFDSLPEQFQRNMENVRIVIEDAPSEETLSRMKIGPSHTLLGLYHGIPLKKRGVWYGMSPVVPDEISLYQRNIEQVVASPEALAARIREVLIHEIAHYYSMDEDQVRAAGY